MQSGAWIALLHQIPKNQHDNLIFTTVAGIEIAVQAVQRIDADYILVRGRQTGVTDAGGGFFFIPYAQILYMGFQKPVRETVIRAMYGEASIPEPGQEEPPVSALEPEPVQAASTPQPPEPVAAPSSGSGGNLRPSSAAPLTPEPPKSGGTNKAALLERLRSRRQDSGNSLSKA